METEELDIAHLLSGCLLRVCLPSGFSGLGQQCAFVVDHKIFNEEEHCVRAFIHWFWLWLINRSKSCVVLNIPFCYLCMLDGKGSHCGL